MAKLDIKIVLRFYVQMPTSDMFSIMSITIWAPSLVAVRTFPLCTPLPVSDLFDWVPQICRSAILRLMLTVLDEMLGMKVLHIQYSVPYKKEFLGEHYSASLVSKRSLRGNRRWENTQKQGHKLVNFSSLPCWADCDQNTVRSSAASLNWNMLNNWCSSDSIN